MSEAIKGLKPELVWKYFAEIAKIPRGSKNEAAVARYVLETAKKLGLQAQQDKIGNVVVKKPASPGKERLPSVALQGHLDMVCEKNAGTVHDFTKDAIELVRKNDVIMANGTTLGADNGIAVATNLAIMEDKSLAHGPLEFLFTIDEEVGLGGASNLQPGFIESKTLMNLDSEEEGALYVGCSGGMDTVGRWELDMESAPSGSVAATIKVNGLRGGHSGLEIDKNRGNAIKILNRTLLRLEDLGVRLSSIHGGNKRNAIPRECEAVCFVPKKNLEKILTAVKEVEATVKAEFASTDADVSITFTPAKGTSKGKVIRKALQKKLTRTISGLPHGVIKMSPDIKDLVETSTNVAVIRTEKKMIVMETSQRSSVGSELEEIACTASSVFEMGHADVSHEHSYPGWKPDMKSRILGVARTTYKNLYGKEPQVKAIHAGLECGIIGEKYPGIDMVSFGPTLEGVHSPDEKIYIDTVEKFWKFLLEILKNVK
jgi:dipeptidase D